jgi:hypothetical protein
METLWQAVVIAAYGFEALRDVRLSPAPRSRWRPCEDATELVADIVAGGACNNAQPPKGINEKLGSTSVID